MRLCEMLFGFLLKFFSLIKFFFKLLKPRVSIYIFKSKDTKMNVTKQNFNEVLPKIQESIQNATFLSIDCEFTGLSTARDINSFDTIPEYYRKIKRNTKDFLVVQYGLSAFRYDEDKNVFKQASYNFYIFRRPVNRNIPDQRFLCQTSSIDFLITQGFDFNKLFKEGISYLNLSEETKYKENLDERKKVRLNTSMGALNTPENKVQVPESDQPYIDNVIKQFEEFLESSETVLELPRCNPFLRKLIYQTNSELFADKIALQTKTNEKKDRVLFATKIKSDEELKKLETQKNEDDLKEFDEALGFTKVLRMIVNSGKLVIGHNMCLDLLHTVDKFLTPLPENYHDFKDCTNALFNNVLDTKYMCNSDPFKDLVPSSVLGHLVETISQKPFEIPKIEVESDLKGYSLVDKKEHEAAYDSYITGVAFLAMWRHIGSIDKLSDLETFSNFNLLKPYLNKIFLMRLQDNPYIFLGGKDPRVARDHVFYLSFPKDWKITDIQQLFSPFGNVQISWLDESSAYVGLYQKSQANLAYSSLSQSEKYIIMPYAKRQAQLERLKTPLSTPKRKESIEENQKCIAKKRTTEILAPEKSSSKRSFPPLLVEEPKEKLKKLSKAFQEDSTWE